MRTDFQSIMALIPTGAGTLAEAIDFYVQQLGFEVTRQWESGAILQRGSVQFMLVPNNNREWAENSSFSIGVADLEALFAEYKECGAPMTALEVKPWGRREFHMIVPSGVCLQFFQQD